MKNVLEIFNWLNESFRHLQNNNTQDIKADFSENYKLLKNFDENKQMKLGEKMYNIINNYYNRKYTSSEAIEFEFEKPICFLDVLNDKEHLIKGVWTYPKKMWEYYGITSFRDCILIDIPDECDEIGNLPKDVSDGLFDEKSFVTEKLFNLMCQEIRKNKKSGIRLKIKS